MPLSIAEKKRFRRIGHELSPVILTGGSGITEGVLAETDRALEDHELIKVRVNGEDREERSAAIQLIAAQTKSQIVQIIGKIVLLISSTASAIDFFQTELNSLGKRNNLNIN